MNRFTRRLSVAGAALLLATAGAPAQGDDFYEGKTVTVYVGFGPGGGYDAYARLLGKHIGSHIPGNPTVVVKNMAGAGSLTLANFLYNTAPKDGTAFGIIASGIAFSPLIGSEQEKQAVRFDPRKFTWLGSISQFTPIGITWRESGIETIDQMKEKEVTYGSSGAGSGNEVYGHLMNDMLGTKLKPIRGYRGSADISLAMERGEVDGFLGWCWTCMLADKPHYVEENLVSVFAQFGLEPDPAMPDVPYFLGMIKDPADRQVVELIFSNLPMSRPFVAPPDIPAERTEILRTALEATVTDPAFLADAEKAHRVIVLFTGAQIDELLEQAYTMPKDVIDRAAAAVTPTE